MRRLLAAFGAVFCFVAAAKAEECRSLDKTLDQIRATGGTARVVTNPHAIERAVSLYNALPGEQINKADALVIVTHRQRGGALFYGADNSICRMLSVPAVTWPDVRAVVLGIEV